ncbi:MAG: septum formation initiator family protein [Myxococcales bacterium]|nr:septum formation initiator family protein [Myxococcales bacterium]
MRRFLWIPAILGVAALYAVIDDVTGLRPWLRLRGDFRASQERIAGLQLEIAALRRESTVLENDPAALERAIREDLEFARPAETVVRLPSSTPTTSRIH